MSNIAQKSRRAESSNSSAPRRRAARTPSTTRTANTANVATRSLHAVIVDDLGDIMGPDPVSWAATRAEGIARVAGEAVFHGVDADGTRVAASDAFAALAALVKLARILNEHRGLDDTKYPTVSGAAEVGQ